MASRPRPRVAPDDVLAGRSSAVRLLPNLSLVVLGLLITHETAYSLATWFDEMAPGGAGQVTDHRHQSLLVAAAGPLCLWVTAWFVLRQVRQLRFTATWSPTAMSMATAGLYVAQESIEIWAAGADGPGLSGLVENRAIPFGVLLAPLVARFLIRLLRRVEMLVEAWLTAPASTFQSRTTRTARPARQLVPTGVVHTAGAPRAPPFRDVTTENVFIS